jgi:hypothetical protein
VYPGSLLSKSGEIVVGQQFQKHLLGDVFSVPSGLVDRFEILLPSPTLLLVALDMVYSL